MGVVVTDVVKMLALVVEIMSVGDQVQGVAATKIDIGMTPPTVGGQIVLQDMSGRPAN